MLPLMPSQTTTVAEYLAALPPDRRAALSAVRQVIQDNLDPTYVECVQYGMIGYAVPHSVFPAGYHCDPKQPLPFAALASQKNYMSLHLMGVYLLGEERAWLEKAWRKSGKKLDMGKACVRFKSVDDLALDVIGEALRRVPARKYIARYEANLATMKSRPTKGAPRKAAPSAKGKGPAAKPPAKARPRSRAARG
jgi:hypothetical protein